jgi:hypothetical protein
MKRQSNRSVIVWSLALAAVIEAITAALRFGFDLSATAATADTVGALTGGIRIHHGYIGILLLIGSRLFAKPRPRLCQLLLIAGAALLVSDLVHHFLILWPLVGSPQFDLVYPR